MHGEGEQSSEWEGETWLYQIVSFKNECHWTHGTLITVIIKMNHTFIHLTQGWIQDFS